jgi:hypothetical protein
MKNKLVKVDFIKKSGLFKRKKGSVGKGFEGFTEKEVEDYTRSALKRSVGKGSPQFNQKKAASGSSHEEDTPAQNTILGERIKTMDKQQKNKKMRSCPLCHGTGEVFM